MPRHSWVQQNDPDAAVEVSELMSPTPPSSRRQRPRRSADPPRIDPQLLTSPPPVHASVTFKLVADSLCSNDDNVVTESIESLKSPPPLGRVRSNPLLLAPPSASGTRPRSKKSIDAGLTITEASAKISRRSNSEPPPLVLVTSPLNARNLSSPAYIPASHDGSAISLSSQESEPNLSGDVEETLFTIQSTSVRETKSAASSPSVPRRKFLPPITTPSSSIRHHDPVYSMSKVSPLHPKVFDGMGSAGVTAVVAPRNVVRRETMPAVPRYSADDLNDEPVRLNQRHKLPRPSLGGLMATSVDNVHQLSVAGTSAATSNLSKQLRSESMNNIQQPATPTTSSSLTRLPKRESKSRGSIGGTLSLSGSLENIAIRSDVKSAGMAKRPR